MASTLVYILAYLGLISSAAIIVRKVCAYRRNPLHVRWEIYPVPHEADRAAHGGSYLEDVDWWKHKQQPNHFAACKALLAELLFLRLTLESQPDLWRRTYPFHAGIYLLLGAIFLTLLAALAALGGIDPGLVLTALGNIVQVLSFVGFLGIIWGGVALIRRRLNTPDLRIYSTREHFFNLGAFVCFAALGLLNWLASPSFFLKTRAFIESMLTFAFLPLESCLFGLFLVSGFALAAYVPATHMGHFFMKYFLYHDIRWDDRPVCDSPDLRAKIAKALAFPVSWRASHIAGDGVKTWAEAALENPAQNAAKDCNGTQDSKGEKDESAA
ncbi:MAG: nitrate reductase [Desulfovibrio sp.]|jgi:nitrate reductase gamma subunit|nr:nitrate reductase [Desulfovibrio sp.]